MNDLTPEQERHIDDLRYKVLQCLITETEAFYKQHPELRVHWSFKLAGEIRETERSHESRN
jgi:hypothetical protein